MKSTNRTFSTKPNISSADLENFTKEEIIKIFTSPEVESIPPIKTKANLAGKKYEIRTMKEDEISFAIKLADDLGWNPGKQDAACFYCTDPNGFFIGTVDGEPVSCMSAVNYGEGFGFLGLWIVKPEYRGHDFGKMIWEHAIKHLDDCEVIGLDGVLGGVADYEEQGFQTEYHNIRFQGEVAGLDQTDDPRIITVTDDMLEKLIEYDASLFPAARPEFVKHWISRPKTVVSASVENGDIAGYAVGRECFFGYKIGPLFAIDAHHAKLLLDSIVRKIGKGNLHSKKPIPIFLDVPEINIEAIDLAKKHGFTKVGYSTARMYRLKNLKQVSFPVENWFGITSFELG